MGSSRLWHIFTFLSVFASVGVTVMLMSISSGVEREVNTKLGVPALKDVPGLNVGEINSILYTLTVVIGVAMVMQTILTTSVIAIALMTTREKEIGSRRQSGAPRWKLVLGFFWEMKTPILWGALVGEIGGVVAGGILSNITPLRVRYLLEWHGVVVVVTIGVALAAIAIPAFVYAGKAPKGSAASV